MHRPALLFTLAAAIAAAQQPTQPLDSIARGRAHDMLHQTYNEVKDNYYDPKFHGIDLQARFHEYDAKIDKATTQGNAFRVIAAFLSGFKDSHLFFIPPARPYRYDAGYRSQIIGDTAFVTQVRPHSDAAEKLQIGDRIDHFNGFEINRADNWNIEYFFRALAPAMTVELDITSPQGKQKQVEINSKTSPRDLSVNLESNDDIAKLIRDDEGDEHLIRERYLQVQDVFVWKMSLFASEPSHIDSIFSKIRAHKALVLDLRGNPGGRVATSKQVVANLFDHDVKVFDEVSRKQTKPIIAKTVGKNAFSGKLIVLIDSGSASGSEILARIVQLEHRGTVIGDISAGAVMESLTYPESVGDADKIFYALSITHADAIMADGKSLEKVGVTPEERLLPTADDLAAGKDPVLAHAIALAGGTIDPAAAGKLFPFEWPAF